MAKYIDAELLRKEIEWRLSYIETATGDYAEGRKCELRYLLSIIDVPHQKQPDDICKEGGVECSPIMRELLNKFIEIGNTFNFGFGPKDIQQEQPEQPTRGYDEAYLNEKITKATKSWKGVDVDKFMDMVRGKEPVDKSLEEAADNFAHGYDNGTCDGIAQECFIAGAEWKDKQANRDEIFHDGMKYAYDQLMKEAVEGTLGYGPHLQKPIVMLEQVPDIWDGGCKPVKVIVIKED